MKRQDFVDFVAIHQYRWTSVDLSFPCKFIIKLNLNKCVFLSSIWKTLNFDNQWNQPRNISSALHHMPFSATSYSPNRQKTQQTIMKRDSDKLDERWGRLRWTLIIVPLAGSRGGEDFLKLRRSKTKKNLSCCVQWNKNALGPISVDRRVSRFKDVILKFI